MNESSSRSGGLQLHGSSTATPIAGPLLLPRGEGQAVIELCGRRGQLEAFAKQFQWEQTETKFDNSSPATTSTS